jgi:hypothetical protein
LQLCLDIKNKQDCDRPGRWRKVVSTSFVFSSTDSIHPNYHNTWLTHVIHAVVSFNFILGSFLSSRLMRQNKISSQPPILMLMGWILKKSNTRVFFFFNTICWVHVD